MALAAVYVTGVLATWAVVGDAPFHPESGHLTGSWRIGLLITAVFGGFAGGWVSRRVGDDRSTAALIAILVGLAVIVALTEIAIGPTASGRAFVEELFGFVPPDTPLAELLDGRPRPWFAVTSYVLSVLAIVAGAGAATRGSRNR